MAFKNVTAASTFNTPYRVNSARIVINNGWTGTIVLSTVINSLAVTVATITNPTTGQSFPYWDLVGGMTVVTTGASFGDMTINWSGNRQPF